MVLLTAMLSEDRVYRYSLTRDAAPLLGEGTVTFIGLNPSTADETQDDPTIRRCLGFARRWGFARLKMLNLYAYRATEPAALWGAARRGMEIVGDENDCTMAKVIGGSDLVICAWGAPSTVGLNVRVEQVLPMIAAPHALGLTIGGGPRHPLYVNGNTLPQPFAHCPPEAAWRPDSNQDTEQKLADAVDEPWRSQLHEALDESSQAAASSPATEPQP